MSNASFFIRIALVAFGEFFFPPRCVGCGKHSRFLCARCFQTAEYMRDRHSAPLSYCSVSSLYQYSGVVKKLIALYKYQGVIGVGETLAKLLYYCLPMPPHDYVTWVPLHYTKQRIRGFNQTENIARELAKLTHKPALELLQKITATTSQMSLQGRSQRIDNILGSIMVPPKVKEQLLNILSNQKKLSILLIDDVFTTGATLDCCSESLKKISEHITIHAVTIAHGH